ncbi:hypothetical protein ABAC460_19965 [Asticcacaulis sp. AC460]|uniref:hypothetical protein n=1 Tax=Asticcacaulis sp. AC460 TaxID=1282360 RepID=UPI0003C3D49E|nr:hypothetical protein [Asticcacaulis sp. AC460]ESQ87302.1 hypothetical protein ABAC460_19965 [Asticcacaulis sp. AC460]
MIDKVFFGTGSSGATVFYRFGNRGAPHPVTRDQENKLRMATLMATALITVMAIGGLTYFIAVTFLITTVLPNAQPALPFDPVLLYLGDVAQTALIGVVVLIYDLNVKAILRL